MHSSAQHAQGNLRSIVTTVKRGKEYPRADYRPITQQEWGNDD